MNDSASDPARPSRHGLLRAQAPKIFGVIAALIAAYAMNSFLRGGGLSSSSSARFTGPIVGEIQSLEGEVLIKPPRGSRFQPAAVGPLHAESVLQVQAASAAVVEFRPGPTLRLLENSRLVAEVDSARDGAIQATLLAGDVSVLNNGENPLFTLRQGGEEVNYRDALATRTVPLIQIGESAESQTPESESPEAKVEEALEIERESEMSAAPAPQPDEPATDPRPGKLPAKSESGLLGSTLTNDDIRSQVRSQAGGFQKCYVTMVNRMSESGASLGSLPRGEILVSFKILSTGKVEAPKVLRTPFQDATFERCVGQALSRLRFRQFQGPTIPVAEFPIALE